MIKKLFSQLVSKVAASIETSARARVARELMVFSDHQLNDLGLSRIRLHEGAAGYPWKLTSTADITPVAKASTVTVASLGENQAA